MMELNVICLFKKKRFQLRFKKMLRHRQNLLDVQDASRPEYGVLNPRLLGCPET